MNRNCLQVYEGQNWPKSCIKRYRKNIAISSSIAIFSDVSKRCDILLSRYITIQNAQPWSWWALHFNFVWVSVYIISTESSFWTFQDVSWSILVGLLSIESSIWILYVELFLWRPNYSSFLILMFVSVSSFWQVKLPTESPFLNIPSRELVHFGGTVEWWEQR